MSHSAHSAVRSADGDFDHLAGRAAACGLFTDEPAGYLPYRGREAAYERNAADIDRPPGENRPGVLRQMWIMPAIALCLPARHAISHGSHGCRHYLERRRSQRTRYRSRSITVSFRRARLTRPPSSQPRQSRRVAGVISCDRQLLSKECFVPSCRSYLYLPVRAPL